MLKYRILALLGFLAVEAAEHYLRHINISHMKRTGPSVPEGFEGALEPGDIKKAQEYTIDGYRLSTAESILQSALLILFLYGGILDLFNSLIASSGLPGVLKGTVFFMSLSLAGTTAGIPLGLYRTFRIENRYGFNTMTLKLWVSDFFRTLLVSAVIMATAVAAALWVVEKSPDWWWLYAWGLFLFFGIFLMYLSPYVIEPLFNRFEPLGEGSLELKIREMMKKAGLGVSRVFTMDASKRSRHTNAYFTGIGKVKRIVLYDTLIGKLGEDEVVAVLAHEIGHWKKRHVLKMLVLFETLSLAAFWICFRILQTGVPGELFGLTSNTFYAQVFIMGFLLGIVSFPLGPILSFILRRHEDEADRFAVDISSTPENLAGALIKLSKDNLANLHPHPLYAKLHYSHPPVVERVARIRRYGRR